MLLANWEYLLLLSVFEGCVIHLNNFRLSEGFGGVTRAASCIHLGWVV